MYGYRLSALGVASREAEASMGGYLRQGANLKPNRLLYEKQKVTLSSRGTRVELEHGDQRFRRSPAAAAPLVRRGQTGAYSLSPLSVNGRRRF